MTKINHEQGVLNQVANQSANKVTNQQVGDHQENSNQQFYISIAGTKVTVSEEIYREYSSMGRRARYLEERDVARGVVSYNSMDTDEMLGEDMIPDFDAKSVEEAAFDRIMADKLREALELLTDDERELIEAIFYDQMSEREYSVTSGIPRKTISDRKHRILAKLRKLLG